MAAHLLDRPVWNALTTRQAGLTLGGPCAVRLDPDYGPFAAAADAEDASLVALGALLKEGDWIWTVEARELPPPPGVTVARRAVCHQMLAREITPARLQLDVARLTDADAPQMLTLAALTAPGPFSNRTHELGDFIGVIEHGRLVAMAGERLRPEGFTEVSGVCTHPDHRGKGYAAGLMRLVAERIIARGETPLLHVYADNAGAINLYETLGFTLRRAVTMTVLTTA